MSILGKLRSLDPRYYAVIGILLALVFGSITVYTTFIYEKRPEISFDILSNYPVYDVREDIQSLQVLFAGDDIKKKGQTLSILTVRLSNTGNASLLLSHFDNRETFGMSLNETKVLKVDPINASNDYLTRAIPSITTIKDDKIMFAPLIMDKKDYVTLKLLLLHRVGLTPEIVTFGKIAEVRSINVIDSSKSNKVPSFLFYNFGGNLTTQILRMFIYGILFTITVGSLILVIILVSTWSEKWKRKHYVKEFRLSYDDSINEKCNRILEGYIKSGEYLIVQVHVALTNENAYSRILDRHNYMLRKKEALRKDGSGKKLPSYSLASDDELSKILFKDESVIKKNLTGLTVEPACTKFIEAFISYLNRKIPDKMKRAGYSKK